VCRRSWPACWEGGCWWATASTTTSASCSSEAATSTHTPTGSSGTWRSCAQPGASRQVSVLIFVSAHSVGDPCSSVLRIRDVYPDPGSQFFSSRKNLGIFTPKIVSKLSENDPSCSSRIRILIFTYTGSQIQGSKRHRIPDPGSRFATLIFILSRIRVQAF
jgi:hypothetical protein